MPACFVPGEMGKFEWLKRPDFSPMGWQSRQATLSHA